MAFDHSLDLCRRNSFSKTLTVSIACDLQPIRVAATYLSHHGVPLEVARRVLLTPHLRRRTK